MIHKPMWLIILLHTFTPTVRGATAYLASAFSGAIAGTVALLAATDVPPQAPASIPFWETPTGAAALVSGLVLLTIKGAEFWWNNRQKTKDGMKDTLGVHITTQQAERQQLLDGMRQLHEEEMQFAEEKIAEAQRIARSKIIQAKLFEFEGRERAHAYGNECNRLQSHIYRQNILFAQHEIEAPAFEFKSYPDIMAGLEDKVLEYRKKLEQEDLSQLSQE